MWDELKRHERFVRRVLEDGRHEGLGDLRDHHLRRVADFQHERLIHLLVTLFVALFALLAVGWALVEPSAAAMALAALLLGLTAAYLVHYFRLENGVQRLYRLTVRLDERIAGHPLSLPPSEGDRDPDRGA
jgi:hypothetical protein